MVFQSPPMSEEIFFAHNMQANPYYDFEEVIDSDEDLDLASMVSAS